MRNHEAILRRNEDRDEKTEGPQQHERIARDLLNETRGTGSGRRELPRESSK
jgi:hypothetical protein